MALPSTYSGVGLQNVCKNGQMETQPLTQRKTGSFDTRPVQEATFPERNLIWLCVNEAGSGGG